MSGIRGKTDNGGIDIIEFLTEVAKHFDLNIVITSGCRTPQGQASAMYENWKKLQHGRVYSRKSLPEAARAKLDAYFEIAQNERSSPADRAKAKSVFLKLAVEIGVKSKHCKGRAVDIAQQCLSLGAYHAIVLKMQVVREGNRHDIYHFESDYPIPRVTKADKLLWGLNTTAHQSAPPGVSGGSGCIECGS